MCCKSNHEKTYKCSIWFFCLIGRYSFAIVGINMTELVYVLLKKGSLRTHFYNMKTVPTNLDDFHEVYCKLCLGMNLTGICNNNISENCLTPVHDS